MTDGALMGIDSSTALWYQSRMDLEPSGPRASAAPAIDPAAVRAWCLYDWANSAFATTVMVAVLPAWFHASASRAMPAHLATATWGYTVAIGQALAALAGPLAGAFADRAGARKPVLLAGMTAGALATAALAAVPAGAWPALALLFVGAYVAFSVSLVTYDALLPAVAGPADMDRVSARGFALGYLGGGLLLALNLAWILMPRRFGLPDVQAATRLSFVSVAVWWAVFSLPLARRVPEPARATRDHAATPLADLLATVRSLGRQPELLRFLLAFWLYSDGIGTVMRMATAYGSEVGIGRDDLIGALLMVQIVAAPASLAFGRLARPLGPQRAIVLALAGYGVITLLGFVMSRPWHFWALAGLVALFQGGAQALSRSMFARLAPASRRASLFGFYAVSEKVAGVVGPLAFGVVATVAGTSRWAVLVLLPMFAAGAALLLTVDLARGTARAAAEDGSAPAA
jgi:MFS transporter, UMF1 family